MKPAIKGESSSAELSCNKYENRAKGFEGLIGEDSDVDEEFLNSVFEATRNNKSRASICSLTIQTKQLGLAAVDVRGFSDISYASCFSPDICVLFVGSGPVCEDNDPKLPKRKSNRVKPSAGQLQAFKEVKVLKHPANVSALCYTNEDLLLSCCLDGTVRAWDPSYDLVHSYMDTKNSLSDIHANSKEGYFVTSSLSRLRDSKGKEVYGASLFSFSRSSPVMSLIGQTAPTQVCRLHANGFYIAAASEDGTIKMWSTQTSGSPVRSFQDTSPEGNHRKMIAFSPDGKYLASK